MVLHGINSRVLQFLICHSLIGLHNPYNRGIKVKFPVPFNSFVGFLRLFGLFNHTRESE